MKSAFIFLGVMVAVSMTSAASNYNFNPAKDSGIVMESGTWSHSKKIKVDAGMDGFWEVYKTKWNYSEQKGGNWTEHADHLDTNLVSIYTTDDTVTFAPDHSVISEHYVDSRGFEDDIIREHGTTFPEEEGSLSVHHAYSSPVWPLTESKSAKVKMMLHTGGQEGIGKQGLYALTATATEEGIEPFFGSGIQEIPPDQISVGGSTLGSDGIRWKTLPDGESEDVTPQASASMYGFDHLGAPKYSLSISANGNDLSQITPEFCVGQLVSFVPGWDPQTPPYVDSIQHWGLPGKYVNEPYQYSAYCNSYRVNSDLLTNRTTHCWYVNEPGGICGLNMSLKFSNGQTAGIAAQGEIMVVKPSIEEFVSSLDALFDPTGGETHADLNWATKVRPPAHFSGQAQYVQLVKREAAWDQINLGICWPTPGSSTGGEFWLDKSYPYPDPGTPTPLSWDNYSTRVNHQDVPGFGPGLCHLITVNDAFKTYLQFQPDGGISVTIGRIDWGWTCSAWQDNGAWTWLIFVSDPSPDWSDDSFPLWTQIYQ